MSSRPDWATYKVQNHHRPQGTKSQKLRSQSEKERQPEREVQRSLVRVWSGKESLSGKKDNK